MRIAVMATMLALAGIAAQAEENVKADEPSVTVCTEGNTDPRVAAQSQAIASEMYAGIGVRIDWRQGLGGCPPQAIQISLIHFTRPTLLPGALAYALPYEGTRIHVFYDRIAAHGRDLLPYLLAHVMAHEIAHTLQGISRHSEQGVMKAQWTEDDYERMMRKPLEFTTKDIDLIHRGLAAHAIQPEIASGRR
jgi:hypothetical protein